MDALRTVTIPTDRVDGFRFQVTVSLLVTCLALILVGSHMASAFSIESIYVLWYTGFVVTVGLLAPSDASSREWVAIQWALRFGFLVLCYFVGIRVMEVIQA